MIKRPLYRKVNATAHGGYRHRGGDYSDERNSKQAAGSEAARGTMHGHKQRGLDYTPLFRFLLSKVGSNWQAVYTQALARLDRPDPIFWMVALREEDEQEYVRIGESSYFSGLKVDADGLLQRVNPDMGPHSLAPFCKCCTHTFNGVRFTREYDADQAPFTTANRFV